MVEAKKARRTAFNKAIKAIPDNDTVNDETIDTIDDFVVDKQPQKRKTVKKKSADELRVEKILVDGRLDSLLKMPSEEESTEGVLIKINKYWPYPMVLDGPEDPNLLLLSTYKGCGQSSCLLCGPKENYQNGPVDLIKLVDAEFSDRSYSINIKKILSSEDWPASKGAFEDECRQLWDRYFEGREPARRPTFYNFGCKYKARLSPTTDTSVSNYCQPSRQLREEEQRYGPSYQPMNHFEFDVGYEWLKQVWYKGKFYVYFKLDKLEEGQKVSDVLKHLSLNSDAFVNGLLSDGFLDRSTKIPKSLHDKLPDTSDFVEAIVPEGFSLKLRNYQSRTLSWMKKVESCTDAEDCCLVNTPFGDQKESFVKISFNNEPLYWDVFSGVFAKQNRKPEKLTPNPATHKFPTPLRIRGGILADDTGSGKTVTCLALIHSCPFDEEMAKNRIKGLTACLPYKIPSQATCIVVPGNLYQQWIDEALRCNSAFRIVGISTFEELKAASVKQVMLADIVIVTRELLNSRQYQEGEWHQNKDYNYHQKKDKFDAISYYYEACPRATSFPFSFSSIHFHRVIYDEIHEIYKKIHYMGKFLGDHFSADNYWGLTGTPCFTNPEDFQFLLPFLGISKGPKIFEKNVLACKEFIGKFIKRNIPNLQLPPVSQEVIWVEATATELALMNASVMYGVDRAREIMMCCHYQISDMIASAVVESFMTIEEVKISFETAKMAELNLKRSQVQGIFDMLDGIKDKDDEDSKFKLPGLQAKLKQANHQLEASQSSYNYFINVFKILETTNETEECLICRDQIAEENLAVLPCSHYYCYECINCSMQRNLKCPFCSYELCNRSEVIRIRGNLEKQGETLKRMGLDISKYGSKLIAFYEFITDLFITEPDARLILFLQYKKLADFVSSTLDELKIKHSRVHGSTANRTEAIRQFKNSKDTHIIMLSSEESASGINLTEATHVVLLHPFWTGQGETVDRAWEKQGISRVYRFGLEHPLKVVRFAVKNTIDEELTLARQNVFH